MRINLAKFSVKTSLSVGDILSVRLTLGSAELALRNHHSEKLPADLEILHTISCGKGLRFKALSSNMVIGAVREVTHVRHSCNRVAGLTPIRNSTELSQEFGSRERRVSAACSGRSELKYTSLIL